MISESENDAAAEKEARREASENYVGGMGLLSTALAIALAIAGEWLFAAMMIGVAAMWFITTWLVAKRITWAQLARRKQRPEPHQGEGETELDD